MNNILKLRHLDIKNTLKSNVVIRTTFCNVITEK